MSLLWRKRLFFLLLPLLASTAWWQTRIETDLNAFFTNTEREDAALLAGFLQSGEWSRRYLLLVEPTSAEAPSPVSVRSFSARLVRRLQSLDGVERVWPAGEPPRAWLEAMRTAASRAVLSYSLDPVAEAPPLFDPAALPQRAEGLRQALLSPQAEIIKPIAKSDPLLLSLQPLRGLKDRLGEQAAGGDGGILLQSRAPSLDAEVQGKLQADIRAAFDAMNRDAGGVFRLGMTGIPAFTVAAHDQISHDVVVVSTVSSLGVILVFLLLFRSFAALHWVLLIVAASYGVGVLATAWVFGTVHSLTLALGSTLTGVCVDYPIHVLAHVSETPGESPTQAVKRVWASLFIGSLTTVVGYCALGFTGFPGFRQVAVFSAAAIIATLFLTRWVLPALLASTVLSAPRIPGLAGWIGFCRRWRMGLLALLLVGLVGAAAQLPHMRWMDDLSHLTMDMGALKEQDQAIRARLGGVEAGRFVLVQAPTLDQALQRSEAAERRLQGLVRAGLLRGYHGLHPWLLSTGLQRENAEAYAKALTPEFLAGWRTALAKAGLAVDKLGHPAPSAQQPIFPEAMLTPAVRGVLSGQIIEQPDGVALVLWLGAHQPAAVAEALAGLPGVRYFSQRDLLNELARDYRDQSLEMLGWGLLAIYALLWLRYRHASKAFFSLLPAVVAALAIFASWALLGEEVSFVHVLCLLLAVSICEDYGIFFLDNGGDDIMATYRAIGASMLTTAVSFGALGLAENPTLQVVAVAVTLGIVLGFVLCPLLIPGDLRR